MNRIELMEYQGRHYKGWMDPCLSLPPEWLEEPGLLSQRLSAEVLVDGVGRQVFRFHLPGEPKRMAFGYYSCHSTRRAALRGCYASRVLTASRALSSAGFSCPEVLMAICPRRPLFGKGSLVIAREIPGVKQLPAGGNHSLDIHAELDLTAELVVSLGEHIGSMHESSIFHGDLKSRHILVDPLSGRFFLVDVEKCRKATGWPRLLQDVLAARDLIQLFSSLPNSQAPPRWRHDFLRTYSKIRRISPRSQSRIERFIRLYAKEGSFRQGRTLLGNLFGRRSS